MLEALEGLRHHVEAISQVSWRAFEYEAYERLRGCDEDDRPYLALVLLLDCPLWTEDRDFFGCGAALWTSHWVRRYLEG